jgi:hypothetical protein
MPLTEDERAAIVERLSIEQDLRNQLAPKSKEPSKRWWESPLALLLFGAAISSLLVPWLQFTQKNFEWKRQNQFENTKYELNQMRNCLTEFIVLWAIVGEGYERARPLLLQSAVTAEELKAFETQFIDVQNRRFQQNAKVVSLMIHFKDTSPLDERFQEYLSTSAQYFRALESQVRARQGGTAQAPSTDELDRALEQLNSVYEAIVNAMMEQIGSAEDESEKSYL